MKSIHKSALRARSGDLIKVRVTGKMSQWPMLHFSPSSSFVSLHTHTHTHTHTHRIALCQTHTRMQVWTQDSRAVNVVGRKWRQLWFYGFIWSVIFIWPSQVFIVPHSHTHIDYSITILMWGTTGPWRKRTRGHLIGNIQKGYFFLFTQTHRFTAHIFIYGKRFGQSKRKVIFTLTPGSCPVPHLLL